MRTMILFLDRRTLMKLRRTYFIHSIFKRWLKWADVPDFQRKTLFILWKYARPILDDGVSSGMRRHAAHGRGVWRSYGRRHRRFAVSAPDEKTLTELASLCLLLTKSRSTRGSSLSGQKRCRMLRWSVRALALRDGVFKRTVKDDRVSRDLLHFCKGTHWMLTKLL